LGRTLKPKLVRDRIPEIIESAGEVAITRIAEEGEYVTYLLDKIVEEAVELRGATEVDHQIEEVADLREVLAAFIAAVSFSEDEITAVQRSKVDTRGAFQDRVILIVTSS